MNTVMARETRRLARITASETNDAPVTATGPAASAPKTEEVEGDPEDEPEKKTKKKVVDIEGEPGKDAAAAERTRCAELSKLCATADRLGVEFDASAAISKGMSVDAARAAILDAAAEGDAPETSTIAAPKTKAPEGGKSMDKAAVSAAWKKAMKR